LQVVDWTAQFAKGQVVKQRSIGPLSLDRGQ
jgi:hypothetical protein